MNGGERRGPSSHRPKASLLSTYLVSDDEEDEPIGALEDSLNAGAASGERIEVLPRPSSIFSTNSCGHSNGCDVSANSAFEPSSGSEPVLSPRPSNLWSDDTIDTSTPCRSQYRVIFEIIKAKTITAIEKGIGRNRFERPKYVSYTVLIKRIPGLETKPAVIERRYSEFLTLYNGLKRRYPNLLKDVAFPKKILIGNFTAEVIGQRSMAFQQFLTKCLSVQEIRSSKEFATFLYYPELKEAKRCLMSIHLEEAANLLENVYFIQDKLAMHSGKPSPQLVHTLCCLVGCFNAVDNTTDARRLAERTFEILFENSVVCVPNGDVGGASRSHSNTVYEVSDLYECSQLVLPLILLSLRLRWFSGQQKISLENKLEEMCRHRSLPRNFDSQPTLLEMILKKDFSPILEH